MKPPSFTPTFHPVKKIKSQSLEAPQNLQPIVGGFVREIKSEPQDSLASAPKTDNSWALGYAAGLVGGDPQESTGAGPRGKRKRKGVPFPGFYNDDDDDDDGGLADPDYVNALLEVTHPDADDVKVSSCYKRQLRNSAAQCIDYEILISKNDNIDIEIDKRMVQ